jgi:hypothetical protein
MYELFFDIFPVISLWSSEAKQTLLEYDILLVPHTQCEAQATLFDAINKAGHKHVGNTSVSDSHNTVLSPTRCA